MNSNKNKLNSEIIFIFICIQMEAKCAFGSKLKRLAYFTI